MYSLIELSETEKSSRKVDSLVEALVYFPWAGVTMIVRQGRLYFDLLTVQWVVL